MSKKDDGPWPNNHGVKPIASIPENPKDIAATVFGVIHYPYIGERLKLTDKADTTYRVDAILYKDDQVRLARDGEDGPWSFSYFLHVPLSTWWTMKLRRALGISGGSVDSWKVALNALNDPWEAHHSVVQTGSTTCHVYEITFSAVQEASDGDAQGEGV